MSARKEGNITRKSPSAIVSIIRDVFSPYIRARVPREDARREWFVKNEGCALFAERKTSGRERGSIRQGDERFPGELLIQGNARDERVESYRENKNRSFAVYVWRGTVKWRRVRFFISYPTRE